VSVNVLMEKGACKMSIEYAAVTHGEPKDEIINRIKAAITNCWRSTIIRDAGREFGLTKIAHSDDVPALELITVVIETNRVYIAFHACSRSERETFLLDIKNAFAQNGFELEFEEL
jgi:hypothetical protein